MKAPDEGFGLERTPKPKIQRDPSPPKRKPYMWYAAVNHRLALPDTKDPDRPEDQMPEMPRK